MVKLFLPDGDQTLEQAAQNTVGGFGLSISGGAQNSPRQGPASARPSLRRRLD